MTETRSTRPAAVLLTVCALLASTAWRTHAAGTISGTVFEDFNANGRRDTTSSLPNGGGASGTTPVAVDRGVAGVTVSVFDGAGALQGTAVTNAAGAYSVAAGGTGPYRVEFTTLPAGYRPSAFATGATGNDTTVQFVPDGVTSNVNLGILDAANFCQNNPTIYTSCFVYDEQVNGPNNAMPVFVDFPYSAGANTATASDYFQPAGHNLMVPANQVGTVFGLGFHRQSRRIYAAAFMKKHAGFGPNGPGAIYTIDPATLPGGAPALFADLDAIFGAGTTGGNGHATNLGDYDRDAGNVGWDAVGKTSLGGLEVSPDGQYVYVVNLADRQIYRLPTAVTPTAGNIVRTPIPVPATAVPAGGADLRPFALQYFRGVLYVGMVNSAETTASAANLRAYVYALDPVAMTFGAAPLLDVPLNYPRGAVQTFSGTTPATWNPWRSTFALAPGGGSAVGAFPQPMLTGLSFDIDGNLTLGMRDRAGDQFGFFTLDNPGNTTRYEGVAGGDTLFAQVNTPGNPAGGWTLESNAATSRFGPTAGANNAQGPGNGEYYFADAFAGTHQELTGGTLLQLPGFPDVISSAFDPGLTVRTGGFIWLRQSNGTRTKGYNLYDTGFVTPPAPTFSKANGFGEMVQICEAAPIEVGNRVWIDTDADGVQDPGEAGLDGVTVALVDPGGVVIATAITANGGQYFFSSAAGVSTGNAIYGVSGLTPNTSGFRVRINPGQPALAGYVPSTANADGTANGDSRDSDGVLLSGNVDAPFNTGAAGDNDHTLDFGFTLNTAVLSLGNLVWLDLNNNGVVDPGEAGVAGATVRLIAADGTTVLATTTTDGTGHYLFTGLAPATYFVEVDRGGPLAGYLSSSDIATSANPNNDVDNDDNGVTVTVGAARSGAVTLTLGGEPTNDGDADPNSNLTVDFGFVRPVSLGNLVWSDVNDNGLADPGESGIAGVTVRLIAADGVTVLATAVTDGTGHYLFTGLLPGTYFVEVVPPAGATSSSDIGSSGNPNNDVDNDDNGVTIVGGAVRSGPVTLGVGTEPVTDGDSNPDSNLTVDFGFVPAGLLSLGNLVWFDTNDNGVVDPGESGIAGVTVRLIAADGATVLGSTTTDASGHYLFAGLAAGTYFVEVVPPSGATSSTNIATSGTPNNDVDNDDNGVTLTGGAVRSGAVTLTVGGEPTTDGDGNPNSNLTVDFGFVPGTGGAVETDVCLQQIVPATVLPGGQMTATYAATNRGPGVAIDLVIEGMLPTGVTVASTSPSTGGVCTVSAGMLDCRWTGATPVGVARQVVVTFQVDPSIPAGTPIALWFMTSSATADPYPACNMVDSYIFAGGGGQTPADLVLQAVASGAGGSGTAIPAAVGQPVSARFSVTNTSAVAARGQYVLLFDEAGLVDVTAASWSPQGWVGVTNSTSATWETGPIAPGAVASLNLTLVPRTGTAARLQLVRIAGQPVDPNAANDQAEITIDAVGAGGGRWVAAGNLDGAGPDEIVTGTGAGETPQVRVFSASGAPLASFFAFDRAFRGGVRVASCDVDNDGVAEIVAAQGPGGGRVRVLSLSGGVVSERAAFDAFEPAFAGGVNVACGDIDGDGRAEVVVGPDGGRAPDVKVFRVAPASATVLAQFQAYEPSFTGGVRVSARRFGGSALVGAFNVVTAPGPGRAGDIRVWSVAGASGALVASAPLVASTAGAQVALADVDGDGSLDLLIAPDAGSGTLVQVFALSNGSALLNAPAGTGGFTRLRAAVGQFGSGPELVVGHGAGEAPSVITVRVGGGVAVRLALVALEQP